MDVKEVFEIIDKVTLPKGNIKPSFTTYHIYLTLHECSKGPSGRKALSNILGIGEGSVRTLIRRLYQIGLIYVDPVAGVLLTPTGLEVLKSLSDMMYLVGSFDLNHSEICSNCRIALTVLKDGVKLVEKIGGVLYVRDLIVKKGGVGGLILYYINGIFKIPNSKNIYDVVNQEFWRGLLKNSSIGDGDCVLASMCGRGDTNCLMYVVEAALDVIRGAINS
ncbi:MAG: hypothetical protein QXD94_05770 [Sulfolobales archaeon]